MIPQLLLEEINLGEKDAKDYYEKYGKEELTNPTRTLTTTVRLEGKGFGAASAQPEKRSRFCHS